jgi:ketosteroid isomerase-like protein
VSDATDLVLRLIDAANTGGSDAVGPFVHPDLVMVPAPDSPDPSARDGVEAAAEEFNTWRSSFEELTGEAVEVEEVGDRVVVALRQRGRLPGGTIMESMSGQIYTVTDGRVSRLEWYRDPAAARAAAGLDPGG